VIPWKIIGGAAPLGTANGDVPTVANGVVSWAAGGGGGGVARTVTTVAYAATVTPELPSGDLVLKVGALTGNLTLEEPSGDPADGTIMWVYLAQDATGGRELTLGAGYNVGADIPESLFPTDASDCWRMQFMYNADATVGPVGWDLLAIARGF
jgi:hypothetical protein